MCPGCPNIGRIRLRERWKNRLAHFPAKHAFERHSRADAGSPQKTDHSERISILPERNTLQRQHVRLKGADDDGVAPP